MKKMGVDVTLVDPDASGGGDREGDSGPTRKCVFGETIANPALVVLDRGEIRPHCTQTRCTAYRRQHVCHSDQLPSVRVGRRHRHPFDHKIHGRPRHGRRRLRSSTAATFDWEAHADKFPGLTHAGRVLPRRHLHRQRFGKGGLHHQGNRPADAGPRARSSARRTRSCSTSGSRRSHLRMPRHCKNAQQVAEYLRSNDQVAWVQLSGTAR